MINRKDTWVICRQIWYIPFIWSLAWFSFWIGYNLFVNKLLLSQIDSLYYYGVTISIVFLLISGYIAKKPKNKTTLETNKYAPNNENEQRSFRIDPDEVNNQKQSANEEFMRKFNIEESARQEPPTIKQSVIEEHQIQKPDELHMKPGRISATSSPLSSSSKSHDQISNSQETPSDCLICPNLVNCPQRQKKIADPETPCPLSKENKERAG